MKKQYFISLFLMAIFFFTGCASLGIRDIPKDILEDKYTNSESEFIDINGVRVHYRDEGKGEPVLLLHGILSSLHTWDGWAEKLKSEYRVIRLDLPPFGLTGSGNFEYSRDNFIKFINDFTEALYIKEYNVAGNSLGGFFAWNLALSYPEKVKKLIVIDPAGYPQDTPLPVKLMASPFIGKISTFMTPEFMVRKNLKDTYGQPEKIDNQTIERYHDLMLREGNREGARKLFMFIENMSTFSSYSWAISEIKQPTMIMWGGRDTWIPTEEMTRNWKRDLPDAELVIFENAGHIPMEEIPGETVITAIKFLSEVQKKRND